ncbi:MAG: hypothetical protein OXD42_11520 [Rhodospirillaceae bacterium]|nr:hypothetical protein [Rhodospirillaceae bacterium]
MTSQIDEQEIVPLGKDERLGREERSKTSAKRSFRRLKAEGKAQVHASKFEPPRNTNEISVNRLDLASEATLAELGAQNASMSGKEFWGWYTILASDVEEVGCRTIPTPLDGNPYHADIVVPVTLDAEDRRDTIREYAIDLAYRATFVPWGEWTSEIV